MPEAGMIEPTHAPAEVRPGDVLLGKYRIDRLIGQGGMGMVLEAWHLWFDERVAIKVLLPALAANPEAVARFEREARMLFKIKSENVCRVLDVAKTEDGLPFMVMEYLAGADLADLMRRDRTFDVDMAIDIALQACSALAEAHVRGIVHRDLKPENLFIETASDGGLRLKLLDFGLSKHRDEEAPRERKLTADQQVMGTPQYMAPEQWLSSKDVGPAADQWSLATILFEMLTGRAPFDAPSVPQICTKVLNEPTPLASDRRPDLPRAIDAILAKALEKSPLERYENVGALAVALSAHASPAAAMRAERALRMLRERHAVRGPDDSFSGIPALSSPPAASDMSATLKQQRGMRFPESRDEPEALSAPRSITAQNWQSEMALQPRHPRLAVIGALAALCALAIGSMILVSGSDEPDATVSAVPSEPMTTATQADPAPESDVTATEDEVEEEQEAPVSSASAVATSTPKAPRRRVPSTKPKRRGGDDKSKPTGDEMFDDR